MAGDPIHQTLLSLNDQHAVLAFFCIHAERGVVGQLHLARRLFDGCGTSDWYSWSIQHWGTKWDAYERESYGDEVIERLPDGMASLTIRFNTAWSPPLPLIDAIAERGMVVNGAWFDEAWCYAGAISDNRAHYVEPCDPSNPQALELYEQVYGEAYEEVADDSEESDEEGA